MATFRAFIATCVNLGLKIYQGDIDTAYLNANLGIKQYLESLDGYPCEFDGHVYMINKALYGLKQSGREWNTEIDRWLRDYGFERCQTEPCLYYGIIDGEFVMLLLYANDLLCATKDVAMKVTLFKRLDKDYGMKDQGLLNKYLFVEVEQNGNTIKIHQDLYCDEIIDRFKFSQAHPSRIPMDPNPRFSARNEQIEAESRKHAPGFGKDFPYRELVGSLIYLATCTRPDIAYAVCQLSRFVQNPTMQHIEAAKRILRYLAGTKKQGIAYTANQEATTNTLIIDGYCDSDRGNDPDTRKSITGYVHCMAGGAVSWASRRQTIVAQSTAEAEYVAACEACMEGQGLRNMLIEVFPEMKIEFKFGIDNQAAYVMATNPTYSRRTRHIELRRHYVRDQIGMRTVELWKVKGEVNPADLLAKPLASSRHDLLCAMIGHSKHSLP